MSSGLSSIQIKKAVLEIVRVGTTEKTGAFTISVVQQNTIGGDVSKQVVFNIESPNPNIKKRDKRSLKQFKKVFGLRNVNDCYHLVGETFIGDLHVEDSTGERGSNASDPWVNLVNCYPVDGVYPITLSKKAIKKIEREIKELTEKSKTINKKINKLLRLI